MQKWWENNFWQKVDSVYTLRVKNFVEIALCHTISEINIFLHFTQKFKMAAKSGGKSPNTLRVKNFVEIALSRTVSEIKR